MTDTVTQPDGELVDRYVIGLVLDSKGNELSEHAWLEVNPHDDGDCDGQIDINCKNAKRHARLIAAAPALAAENASLKAVLAEMARALDKIAGLIDSEAGEPLDDAIRIAVAALTRAKETGALT